MKERYMFCTRYQKWYNSLEEVSKDKFLECNKECEKCEFHKEEWVEED